MIFPVVSPYESSSNEGFTLLEIFENSFNCTRIKARATLREFQISLAVYIHNFTRIHKITYTYYTPWENSYKCYDLPGYIIEPVRTSHEIMFARFLGLDISLRSIVFG